MCWREDEDELETEEGEKKMGERREERARSYKKRAGKEERMYHVCRRCKESKLNKGRCKTQI